MNQQQRSLKQMKLHQRWIQVLLKLNAPLVFQIIIIQMKRVRFATRVKLSST